MSLRSSAQPSLELRIDTGSGGVDVSAPGATIRERDDVTYVRMSTARTAARSTPAPAASPSTSATCRGVRPLSRQEHGLGVLLGLGRAEQHDDVAFARRHLGIGVAAHDAVAPHGGERHFRAAPADLADGSADRPGTGRQHHCVQLFAESPGFVGGAGGVAADHRAQRLVALAADLADRADDARGRHLQYAQRVRDERQRGFQGFRHDLRGAGLEQVLEVRLVGRAHEDRQHRALAAHGPHDRE